MKLYDFLADTSGWFSYFHQGEPFHLEAVCFLSSTNAIFTHDYVLAELIALLHNRRIPRLRTLAYLRILLDHPEVHILWTTEAQRQSALELLFERPVGAGVAVRETGQRLLPL